MRLDSGESIGVLFRLSRGQGEMEPEANGKWISADIELDYCGEEGALLFMN